MHSLQKSKAPAIVGREKGDGEDDRKTGVGQWSEKQGNVEREEEDFIKSALKYVRVRTIRGLIRGRRSAS